MDVKWRPHIHTKGSLTSPGTIKPGVDSAPILRGPPADASVEPTCEMRERYERKGVPAQSEGSLGPMGKSSPEALMKRDCGAGVEWKDEKLNVS